MGVLNKLTATAFKLRPTRKENSHIAAREYVPDLELTTEGNYPKSSKLNESRDGCMLFHEPQYPEDFPEQGYSRRELSSRHGQACGISSSPGPLLVHEDEGEDRVGQAVESVTESFGPAPRRRHFVPRMDVTECRNKQSEHRPCTALIMSPGAESVTRITLCNNVWRPGGDEDPCPTQRSTHEAGVNGGPGVVLIGPDPGRGVPPEELSSVGSDFIPALSMSVIRRNRECPTELSQYMTCQQSYSSRDYQSATGIPTLDQDSFYSFSARDSYADKEPPHTKQDLLYMKCEVDPRYSADDNAKKALFQAELQQTLLARAARAATPPDDSASFSQRETPYQWREPDDNEKQESPEQHVRTSPSPPQRGDMTPDDSPTQTEENRCEQPSIDDHMEWDANQTHRDEESEEGRNRTTEGVEEAPTAQIDNEWPEAADEVAVAGSSRPDSPFLDEVVEHEEAEEAPDKSSSPALRPQIPQLSLTSTKEVPTWKGNAQRTCVPNLGFRGTEELLARTSRTSHPSPPATHVEPIRQPATARETSRGRRGIVSAFQFDKPNDEREESPNPPRVRRSEEPNSGMKKDAVSWCSDEREGELSLSASVSISARPVLYGSPIPTCSFVHPSGGLWRAAYETARPRRDSAARVVRPRFDEDDSVPRPRPFEEDSAARPRAFGGDAVSAPGPPLDSLTRELRQKVEDYRMHDVSDTVKTTRELRAKLQEVAQSVEQKACVPSAVLLSDPAPVQRPQVERFDFQSSPRSGPSAESCSAEEVEIVEGPSRGVSPYRQEESRVGQTYRYEDIPLRVTRLKSSREEEHRQVEACSSSCQCEGGTDRCSCDGCSSSKCGDTFGLPFHHPVWDDPLPTVRVSNSDNEQESESPEPTHRLCGWAEEGSLVDYRATAEQSPVSGRTVKINELSPITEIEANEEPVAKTCALEVRRLRTEDFAQPVELHQFDQMPSSLNKILPDPDLLGHDLDKDGRRPTGETEIESPGVAAVAVEKRPRRLVTVQKIMVKPIELGAKSRRQQSRQRSRTASVKISARRPVSPPQVSRRVLPSATRQTIPNPQTLQHRKATAVSMITHADACLRTMKRPSQPVQIWDLTGTVTDSYQYPPLPEDECQHPPHYCYHNTLNASSENSKPTSSSSSDSSNILPPPPRNPTSRIGMFAKVGTGISKQVAQRRLERWIRSLRLQLRLRQAILVQESARRIQRFFKKQVRMGRLPRQAQLKNAVEVKKTAWTPGNHGPTTAQQASSVTSSSDSTSQSSWSACVAAHSRQPHPSWH